MEQRPINSNGKMLENPVTVNPYDKGYKSGAQTSLFIGPIWVEEALSVNIRTQSNDIPVYGYSEVHFDRLMLGKYSISGQIGIAYTESDYLLRIIEMAKNTSIQDGELQKLIEGRKSIFLDSVKYKLITEKLLDTGKFSFSEQKLTEYATNYVERITREIETTGYNEGSPPNTFELTMITGDIHGSNQSIEIYEGVKIIATGKVLVNNDQDIVEMYEFIGKKKPDRTRNIAVASKTYSFYRPNLMKLAGQVATKLVDKLLSPPSINISGTDFRTSKLITTDKVAIAGFLPALPRMYGKSSTFTEIVYSVEYDKLYTDYTEDNKSKPIESTDIVQVVEAGGIEPVDQPSTKLTYPELSSGFNNTYGKLIQPDRYNLSKYVTAVAPIEVADLTEYVGGSVVMPRFAEKEWGIGSYFPPKLVDTELFTYNDSQLANLTSGTLWCNTMGFRSSASNENTELADEGYIKEIAQPYNTMCIVDKVFVDEDYASGDTYTLNISAPVMLDYYNIKESTSKQLSKIKDPLQIGGIDNTIEFVFSKDGDVLGDHPDDTVRLSDDSQIIITSELDSDIDFKIFAGSKLGIAYTQITTPEAGEAYPPLFDPQFFDITMSIDNVELASTMNKCIYLTPFVFAHDITVPESEYSCDKDRLKGLLSNLNANNNTDSSCDIDMEYDSIITDQSGYFNKDGSIQIQGMCCFKTRKDIKTNNPYLHIFWLVMIAPVLQFPVGKGVGTGKGEDDVTILHTINNQKCGRHLEIYNITRCDLTIHDYDVLVAAMVADGDITISDNISKMYRLTDVVDGSYTYPVKQAWDRFSGFLGGYAFNISPRNITTELLKTKVFGEFKVKSSGEGWTLATALDNSVNLTNNTNAEDDIIKNITVELETMVINIIEVKLKELGGLIVDRNVGAGTLTCKIDSVSPQNDIVSYSLTDEGYADLKSMVYYTADDDSEYTAISLGGY